MRASKECSSPVTKTRVRGFPGGSVVESPPASAGDTGLIPDPGGSHMPWSSWTWELQLPKPTHLRACAPQQKKPGQWEARTTQLESSPGSPQLEKSPRSHEDPAQPKSKWGGSGGIQPSPLDRFHVFVLTSAPELTELGLCREQGLCL